MLEGRHFDRWKTKYDVMEWYIYGVHERYKEIEGDDEYQQLSLFGREEYLYRQKALYSGDYYDNLPPEEDNFYHTVESAQKLLLV